MAKNPTANNKGTMVKGTTKIATYAGDSSGAGNGYYSHKDDYYQNSIGGGSTYKFEEDTWNEGNLPLFLQGYI